MSFPVFPDKHRLPAMVSADEMIEFRRAHGGLGAQRAPDGVVLCLYKGVMRRFAWKHRSHRVPGFLGDFYLLERTRRRVGVLGNIGIGAPAVTSLGEELMAWGTRRLVILSLAGGLQPDVEPGSVVVCDRAIRDEGTSYHYLPPGRDVLASADLVASLSRTLSDRGLAHRVGATWSTDAPYRETREEVERFQAEGVQTVEMESAGLFAAAQVRGAQAASTVIVFDTLAGPRWSASPNLRMLHRRAEAVLEAVIETLREGAPGGGGGT